MSRIPTIKNAMRAFPYSVQANESLSEARRLMAQHTIHHLPIVEGEALVVRQGRVVGIFTTTDALHLLAEQLRRGLPANGDAAA